MIQVRQRKPFKNPVVIAEITDPALCAEIVEQDRRHRMNLEWLERHWHELLPQGRGKFVAVAGREAHLADTAADAWAWIDATHPEDNSGFVHYIRAEGGPFIYASQRMPGRMG